MFTDPGQVRQLVFVNNKPRPALRSALPRPIQAGVAVTIRRSRADVAAVMFNPRYDADWVGDAATRPPRLSRSLQPGDQIPRGFRLLGYRLGALCDVVAHVPDHRLEMVGPPPLGLQIRYEFEGIPEGTIVRIWAQSAPPPRLRRLTPVLSALLRQAVRRDLGRLKALLESGGRRRLR